MAREKPHGSKVWANEIIQGAPFISGFLESTVKDWLVQRSAVLQYWMDQGAMRCVDPKTVFYMIWATTQHYADFDSQILVLNDDKPMSNIDWHATKHTVSNMILRGLNVQTVD